MLPQFSHNDENHAWEGSARPARQSRPSITSILFLLGIGSFLLGPGLRMAQAESIQLYKNITYTDPNGQTAFEWGATVYAYATGLGLDRCYWIYWERNNTLISSVEFGGQSTAPSAYTLPNGPASTTSGIWEAKLYKGQKNVACSDSTRTLVQTAEFDVARTVILGAGTANADGDPPAGGDATVEQSAKDQNFATGNPLRVQASDLGHQKRVFLRFDIADAGISAGSIIDNAIVRLYMSQAPTYTYLGTHKKSSLYDLDRVGATWAEDGITWNNAPATASGSANTVTGTANNTFLRWPGSGRYAGDLTADVSAFLSGKYKNYGWRLSDADNIDVYCSGTAVDSCADVEALFTSTESTVRGRWPVLLIDWRRPTTTIRVIKHCYVGTTFDNSSHAPFDFTGTGGNGLDSSFMVDCGGEDSFTISTDGNYTISEDAPGTTPGSDGFGWEPRSVVCTDTDNGSTVATGTDSATFSLSAASDANPTCVFSNYEADMTVKKAIGGTVQTSGTADTFNLYSTNGSYLPGTPLESLSIPPTADLAGPIGVPLTLCEEPVPSGVSLNKVWIYIDGSSTPTYTLTPGSAGPAPSGIYDPDPAGGDNRCFNFEIPSETNGFKIKINNEDSQPPDTTIDSHPPDPDNHVTPTFTFSGTDNYTAASDLTFQCKIDSGGYSSCTSPYTTPSLADGSHTFYVRAKDQAGNIDPTPASYTWTIDTTKPTITASATAGGNPYTADTWTKFDVVVSFSCADNAGGSGIATDTVAGKTVSAEGVTTSVSNTGSCVDKAGNVADTASFGPIEIDKTPPVSTITLTPSSPDGDNGWYKSSVHVVASATDSRSGVYDLRCELDPASVPATHDALPAPPCAYQGSGADVTTDGQHIVYAAAEDNAGNKETPVSSSFKIDKTAPTGTIAINNGDTYTNSLTVNLNLTCNDATSGCSQMRFSNDNSSWSGYEPYSASKSSWSLATGADGSRTVYVQFKDAAGNESVVSHDDITLDTTKPKSTISFPGNGGDYSVHSGTPNWINGCSPVGICGASTDTGGSGVAKVEVSIRQGTGNYWNGSGFNSATEVFFDATFSAPNWNLPFPASNLTPGTYTVHARGTDKAGNMESSPTATFTINAPPSVIVACDFGSGTVNNCDQTVQYSDNITPFSITATDADGPGAPTLVWNAGPPSNLSIPTPLCSSSPVFSCRFNVSGDIEVPKNTYTIAVTDGIDTTSTVVTINVSPEDASVELDDSYDGAFKVANAGDSGAYVEFSGKYWETNSPEPNVGGGANPGDITKADLSVVLVPIGPGGPITLDCHTGALDGAAGTYQVQHFTCKSVADDANWSNPDESDSANWVPVNAYAVEMKIDTAGYYEGSNEDALTVYDPSLGTTGGGYFFWPGNRDPDTNPCGGAKTNFGFTMKYNRKQTKVQGSLLMICHVSDSELYRFKSNALDSTLAIATDNSNPDDPFGWAAFSGKGTFGHVDSSGATNKGNYSFQAYVEDHADPGAGADKYWIEIKDGNGDVVGTVSLPEPAVDNARVIEGGNIVVPHQSSTGGGGKNK